MSNQIPVIYQNETSLVKQGRVLLSHASILTLPSTTPIIAPGLGNGKLLIPLLAVMIGRLTVGYTNIAVDGGMQILIGNTSALVPLINDAASSLTDLNALLEATAPSINILGPLSSVDYEATELGLHTSYGGAGFTGAEGQALKLATDSADGDFEGGAAGNSLLVNVTYMVFDLNIGQFVI